MTSYTYTTTDYQDKFTQSKSRERPIKNWRDFPSNLDTWSEFGNSFLETEQTGVGVTTD